MVTTYPLQDNAVDFLRLLIDYNSDTVICMDPLAEKESVGKCFLFFKTLKIVCNCILYMKVTYLVND